MLEYELSTTDNSLRTDLFMFRLKKKQKLPIKQWIKINVRENIKMNI